MNDWISVEDRLPEPFLTVIVYGMGIDTPNDVSCGAYEPAYKSFNVVVDEGFELREISHWMYLPNQPNT